MALDVRHIEDEILDQYLFDENARPWIIGFSGGKDSTMLLQLVWKAVSKVDPILRKRHIYVVCNDTLVENPRIVRFISGTLNNIQAAAVEQSMPITVHETRPKLEESFWVKLIGLGYPAPNKFYRWCTERLKIKPTTRFVLDKVSESGEVIILLGTRSAESSTRAASIKKHEIYGQRLRRHQLPNSYVFAPIKDVSTNEVWQYLNQVRPPWGGTHKELVTLYRNANAGDCPLVIDESTPSCGNSRFGCWTCTVVTKDKSMEGLIENGEEWMVPLMDIRNYLVESRDNPEVYRQRERRNGNIEDGKWGPYQFLTRVEILRKVLEAQRLIQQEEKIDLITNQELALIQYYWFRDNYFDCRVSQIYNEVYQMEAKLSKHEQRKTQELDLLKEVCHSDDQEVKLIADLLDLQKSKSLLLRKRGLQDDIASRVSSYVTEIQKAQK